jgi:hypothetical protein
VAIEFTEFFRSRRAGRDTQIEFFSKLLVGLPLDADLCGMAKLGQELLAVFPGKAECAYVRIKPCCSLEGLFVTAELTIR